MQAGSCISNQLKMIRRAGFSDTGNSPSTSSSTTRGTRNDDEVYFSARIYVGSVLLGRVFTIKSRYILINIGERIPGKISKPPEGKMWSVGDTLQVCVLNFSAKSRSIGLREVLPTEGLPAERPAHELPQVGAQVCGRVKGIQSHEGGRWLKVKVLKHKCFGIIPTDLVAGAPEAYMKGSVLQNLTVTGVMWPHGDPRPVLRMPGSEALSENIFVGATLKGTVKSSIKAGVLVNVGEGFPGLIHTSRFPKSRKFKTKEPILVRVLSFDGRESKMGLREVMREEVEGQTDVRISLASKGDTISGTIDDSRCEQKPQKVGNAKSVLLDPMATQELDKPHSPWPPSLPSVSTKVCGTVIGKVDNLPTCGDGSLLLQLGNFGCKAVFPGEPHEVGAMIKNVEVNDILVFRSIAWVLLRRPRHKSRTDLFKVTKDDKFTGKIYSTSKDGLQLDVGVHFQNDVRSAFLRWQDIPKGGRSYLKGDVIKDLRVLVLEPEKDPPRFILTGQSEAESGNLKERIAELQVGPTTAGTVIEIRRCRAVTVKLDGGLCGVLPAHLLKRHTSEYTLGEVLTDLQVIDFEPALPSDAAVWLSELPAGSDAQASSRQSLWSANVRIGAMMSGEVLAIANSNGIFVDIGERLRGLVFTEHLFRPLQRYKVGEKLTLMVTSFGYDGLRLRLREEEPNAIITEPLPEEFDLPEADTFVECVTDKLPLAGGEKDCLVTIAEPPCRGILSSSEPEDLARFGGGHAFPGRVIDYQLRGGRATPIVKAFRPPLERLVAGDRVHGLVKHVEENYILLDVGAEQLGCCRVEDISGQVPKEGEWIGGLVVSEVLPAKEMLILKTAEDSDAPLVTTSLARWQKVSARMSDLKAGDIVDGVVTSVHEFGVFFNVGASSGILCHSKWLSDPLDTYKRGDFRAGLRIMWDEKRNLPSLAESSTTCTTSGEEDNLERIYGVCVGDKVCGEVLFTLPYGLLLSLDGLPVDGFCWEESLDKHPQSFKVGERLENLRVKRLHQMSEIEVFPAMDDEFEGPLS